MKGLIRRNKVWYVALIATFTAAQAPTRALDSQDLLLMQSTVASICTTVSLNGQKVDANVKVGITARISKLFSKLLSLDGNVSGSIERESWNGIATADAGSVVLANMNCRERAFEKLVALLTANAPPREPDAASRSQPDQKPSTLAPRLKPPRRAAPITSTAHGSEPLVSTEIGPQGNMNAAILNARTAAQRGLYPAALRNWLRAAELGDAQAQFEAAQIYDYGAPGVAPDCVAATKWYKSAAAHKLAAAEYNVGGEYFYGCKGHWEADYVEALRWLMKAAADGSPDAEYEIGIIHFNGGAGVPQDRVAAREWFQKAATHGNTRALESLRNIGSS